MEASGLFNLKPDVGEKSMDEMRATGNAMVGVIPGFKAFHLGPPRASTTYRT